MKISASGGTDSANIVLFWPDNLPENTDDVLKEDHVSLIEKLRDEGKLIWFLCDGDGGYSVSIYVCTPIPKALAEICRDEEIYPTLTVKGDGYFGGMEYIFKHNSSLATSHPRMIEKITIPAGSYSATVYRTDINEETYELWLTSQIDMKSRRIWSLYRRLAVGSAAAVLASLVTPFFIPWSVWFWVAAANSLLILGAFALSRTATYKRMVNINAEFKKEYPTYVVRLKPI